MEKFIKEACESAVDLMSKMNPDREVSHPTCDWVCENYMDMVYDCINEREHGIQMSDEDYDDIQDYWNNLKK